MIHILLFLFVGLNSHQIQANKPSKAYFPQWENLECETGHKYLFSEETHNWYDSVAECALYGGWLVHIGNIDEQNCLLKYGNSQNFAAFYWTGAHSPDADGIFVHEYDNNYVHWFSPKWKC